ncbi:MAG: hypothetical protein NTZ12_01235 [Candidatus Aminicenantes bacterium]|nr:hypothetical protein [Candidatus Aminicenantes bacterium]
MRKKNVILLFLALSFILFYGCDVSVNRSIHVRDGERGGGLTSVNGSIQVGTRCRIEGDCQTVNGSIQVGDASLVRDLDTVNGRISLAANVVVDGNATTVNGSIVCGAGSKVHGRVTTVNGRIELKNSEVDDEVSTVNGDVLLLAKSLVRGDIVIKGSHGHLFDHSHIDIRISEGSVVEGGILVNDPDVEVKVYLSKDSTVKGKIKNAQVIRE